MVFLALFVGLGWLLIQVWNAAVAGTVSWTLFSAAAFLGITVFGILSVIFPMLSRFENSLPVLLKNTVLLAMANLPRALGLGVVNALCAFLCLRYVMPLFFLPALAALVDTLFLEPMFKPYLSEDAV